MAIENKGGTVFVCYASSDTRMQMAETNMQKLTGYTLNTPEDAGRTQLCASLFDQMIEKNSKIMSEKYPHIKF